MVKVTYRVRNEGVWDALSSRVPCIDEEITFVGILCSKTFRVIGVRHFVYEPGAESAIAAFVNLTEADQK